MNKTLLLAALLPLSAPTLARAGSLCADAYGMQGRSIVVTLAPADGTTPIVLDMKYDNCAVEGPREENDSPYESRSYKAADGSVMSLATGIGANYSGIYLTLKDGRSVSIDDVANGGLANGFAVEKKDVLLVKGVNDDFSGGSVTPVTAKLAMAP